MAAQHASIQEKNNARYNKESYIDVDDEGIGEIQPITP